MYCFTAFTYLEFFSGLPGLSSTSAWLRELLTGGREWRWRGEIGLPRLRRCGSGARQAGARGDWPKRGETGDPTSSESRLSAVPLSHQTYSVTHHQMQHA